MHERAKFAKKVHGLRAKLFNKKRFKEKAILRKTIAAHEEKEARARNNTLMTRPPYRLPPRQRRDVESENPLE